MRRLAVWNAPVALALLAALTGCQNRPPVLTELPRPELDFRPPPAQALPDATPPQVEPAPLPTVVTPAPAEDPAAKAKPAEPVLADYEKPWYVKPARQWKHLVIHHSATAAGNAAVFDRAHRGRGWDELGYHFVITNGSGGPDGLVQVGPRWTKQKWGAHCGGTPDNEYNEHGIGICLVGSFGHHLPTAAQLASLEKLTRFLIRVYGVPAESIVGHCDCPNAATACPGAFLRHYLTATLAAKLSDKLAVASPPAAPSASPPTARPRPKPPRPVFSPAGG